MSLLERRHRKRAMLGGSLIAAGVLIMWAAELGELPATGSACIWGCPSVLKELVVDPEPAGVAVAPDERSPEADARALEQSLRCKWRTRQGEEKVTVFYDDDEKPLRFEKDVDGDGRPDEWEYLAGDRNVPIRIERDCNGDGRVDRRQIFDAAGKPLRFELDEDFDGAMDVIFP